MFRWTGRIAVAIPVVGGCLLFGYLAYIGFRPTSLTQEARERLSRIEEALMAQKHMVDAALMTEALILEKEVAADIDCRIKRLEKYQRMLAPLDNE